MYRSSKWWLCMCMSWRIQRSRNCWARLWTGLLFSQHQMIPQYPESSSCRQSSAVKSLAFCEMVLITVENTASALSTSTLLTSSSSTLKTFLYQVLPFEIKTAVLTTSFFHCKVKFPFILHLRYSITHEWSKIWKLKRDFSSGIMWDDTHVALKTEEAMCRSQPSNGNQLWRLCKYFWKKKINSDWYV